MGDLDLSKLDIIFNNKLLEKNLPLYREYRYTFNEFINILDKFKFLKPKYQGNINQDKVDEMTYSYKKNPEFFYFKNKIVLSFIPKSKNIYIMDGQHRIESIRNLNNENYNDLIYICCYIIENDEQNKDLFIELNKDSYKNNTYIFLDDFSKDLHEKFINYLDKYYGLYFEKKQKKESYRKTISEFLNELESTNYLLKFDNFNDIKNDFENSNFRFNYIINYQEIYNNNSKFFYKDEHDCVKNGIIFTLKNNNFVDYLIDKSIIPVHRFKKEKKRITATLKKKVWVQEYGNNKKGVCPFNKCTNIITINDYSCGHIISEYNGGKTSLENLKPMCYGCNNKLGNRNWILHH